MLLFVVVWLFLEVVAPCCFFCCLLCVVCCGLMFVAFALLIVVVVCCWVVVCFVAHVVVRGCLPLCESVCCALFLVVDHCFCLLFFSFAVV